MSFRFSILSPGGKAFEGEADYVAAPGVLGGFGVLPGHAPMIAAVQPGLCSVTVAGALRHFFTGEGVLEVNREEVVLLVDEAQSVSDPAQANALATGRKANAANVRSA